MAGRVCAAANAKIVDRSPRHTHSLITDGEEFTGERKAIRSAYAEVCPRSFRSRSGLDPAHRRSGSGEERTTLSDSIEGMPTIAGSNAERNRRGMAFSVDLLRRTVRVGYRPGPRGHHVSTVSAPTRLPDFGNDPRRKRRIYWTRTSTFWSGASRSTTPELCSKLPYTFRPGSSGALCGFFDPDAFRSTGGKESRACWKSMPRSSFRIGTDRWSDGAVSKACLAPLLIYGTGIRSNYQGQNLRLSKHFSPVEPLHHSFGPVVAYRPPSIGRRSRPDSGFLGLASKQSGFPQFRSARRSETDSRPK